MPVPSMISTCGASALRCNRRGEVAFTEEGHMGTAENQVLSIHKSHKGRRVADSIAEDPGLIEVLVQGLGYDK